LLELLLREDSVGNRILHFLNFPKGSFLRLRVLVLVLDHVGMLTRLSKERDHKDLIRLVDLLKPLKLELLLFLSLNFFLLLRRQHTHCFGHLSFNVLHQFFFILFALFCIHRFSFWGITV